MSSPIKDPQGGLTSAGRAYFKRTEGANLKPGVRSYESASVADKKRWTNWATRFAGRSDIPPLKKSNGDPTRFALMFNAWGESVPSSEDQVRAVARKAALRKRKLNIGK